MTKPSSANGVIEMDGVQVSYVLVSVSCTAVDCQAFGIAHIVMMYPAGLPPLCGQCLKSAVRRGSATHFVDPVDIARVAALPIPKEWIS